ncbi:MULTISPECIES: AMP-binding protein [Gammaproteobacteria]|uniref:AMP-binding protein n=1 Tax=Gammaproteobacteria TaxID=1236 RepID=UPI0014033B90|nr:MULTISPECIES: AMP-binding protein [Gammaproteobacteria]
MQKNADIFNRLDYFLGPALLTDKESVSYAELEQRVAEHALEIEQQCINERGEPCLAALAFENNIESVVNYLAALRAQVPLLLIDPDLNIDMKKAMYEKLGVSIVLSGKAIMQIAPWPFHNTQKPIASSKAKAALLLSTSGSSGAPKSVMLSRDNLISNTNSILDYLPIEQADCAITTLPLHYSFGLSVLNTHLAKGARIVLTKHPLMSKEFWQLFREHGVTSLSGVPFHFQMLQMLRLERMELPQMRYLAQAGGKMSPDLVEHFEGIAKDRDWTLYVMYGQTEATARMAYVPPEVLSGARDSIGKAIPGGRFEIREIGTSELIRSSDQAGELWYFGNNVMLGYAKAATDWTLERVPQQSLATGDIAEWTDNGLVRITGRLSRFIKIRGKRLQLDHIEQAMQSISKDILCCGEDDMLYVVNAPDTETTHQYLRESLGLHPSLYQITEVTELPTLSSGKIDFQKLLTMCNKREGE